MKRVITLKKKEKRKWTRPQLILRNLLLIALMIASVAIARSGTFTEEQAYQKQLNALGITERAFRQGHVQVIEDQDIGEWVAGDMNYSFEPIRMVTLETTAGGERVHLQITVGRRGLFWYETECDISYPDCEPPKPPTPGYTHENLW